MYTLSVYFLSKTKALFQWDIFEEIVSLSDQAEILNILSRIQTKTLYLYDIKNITTAILQDLLDLIDINLFGNQLNTIYANKNHPRVFKKCDYNFHIFTVEPKQESPCMEEKCLSNPNDSPFIALGDCVQWDTVKKDDMYEISKDSNVEAIQTLHQKNGDIAWKSTTHGNTLVCFEGMQQLQHAMKNNFLTGWAVFSK